MKTIIAILTILAFAFGAYFYLDDKYARGEDVKKIEKRLDYKIMSDQFDRKEERVFDLEKRYPNKSKMPESVKEEYQKLQSDKLRLEKKLDVMEKQTP